MKEEKPKLPTKDGLKRAQERTRDWLRKQPSDNLVRIIDEVTRNNEQEKESDDVGIAAKPTDRTL